MFTFLVAKEKSDNAEADYMYMSDVIFVLFFSFRQVLFINKKTLDVLKMCFSLSLS